MKIFLDSADLTEIQTLIQTGLIDGVTTNPSLAAAQGMNLKELIQEIAKVVSGPISAEVTAQDTSGMVDQGKELAQIGSQVVIKVPLTREGLKACQILRSQGIPVNVTLCFSLSQSVLAAKSGATYISPFVGRIDDCGADGLTLIQDMVKAYQRYGFETKILAASLRHVQHVYAVIKSGVDVMTLPGKVFCQLYNHPLTDQGLKIFMEDWSKARLSL